MSHPEQESLIVLGGTGSLGTQVLPILADAGYHLVVFSRRQVTGQPFDDPRMSLEIGSLDDTACIDSLVTTALERADTLRGAIFLNGGFSSDQGIGAEGFTEVLQEMMEKNVYPTTKVLSRILPHWKSHGGGKVVLTSATAVERRFTNGGAYATSKMAVDSLARQIQREYEPEEVDVHVLRPRIIGTKKGQNSPADLAQEMLAAIRH
ncbi:SDR family NAD(P)-dependent oxidoreductase [Enteractinococcus coprophilus]|uniref:NAD(P)-dependent dehydrogenase (Short-subunit alcohol dehydrogenase family) n=1 Tax=Enteractinococcus coprophilus TaxID=1027633 RepID=A0A543AM85_9MICC|nr:SDR family oxidoreductase [Enteractinococcus coprophilus]TQL73700.1 NAD(P)-dependent dehydrogenase (short-subunit alcohol dehydrogenase family) [Enteractinococcus coprophilus]